jgi:hypothetical protein
VVPLDRGRRYRGPFRFTGRLDRVVLHVDGEPFIGPDAEVADLLAILLCAGPGA